jgi:AcrR family transcriptional regulator
MIRRRDRRRQETIDDIKDTARSQLARAGPAGISMRAIARQLAMTASAVHYYFPSRQALLDALIVDGFTSLARALRTAYEGAGPRPPGEQWLAVCRAHRAWALDHQAEYLLLYGHDGASAVKQGNA